MVNLQIRFMDLVFQFNHLCPILNPSLSSRRDVIANVAIKGCRKSVKIGIRAMKIIKAPFEGGK